MGESSVNRAVRKASEFMRYTAPAYEAVRAGIQALVSVKKISESIGEEHLVDTPDRVATMYLDEMLAGCWEDPKSVLRTSFEDTESDQMIYVNDISFVSVCAHHLVPFVGKVHFAYIPNTRIVGLSKIPRLIEVYAKRPQVQEKLTREIVNTFNEVVKPLGCGAVIEAVHLCMMVRGVKKETAYTRTTALRGCFTQEATKYEFLDGVKKDGGRVWP